MTPVPTPPQSPVMTPAGASRGSGARTGTSLAVAVGLHLLALAMVPEVRESIVAITPGLGEFVEVEAEPEPEPEPEAREPEPERPRLRDESAPPPPPAESPTPEAPPPPEDEAIEDLSGVTLTNDSAGAGFAVSAGTGEDRDRIESGRATGRNTQGEANGDPNGVPGGTGLVSEADLSVTARPPGNVESILNQNYPREAQQQAIEGTATVAVEVRPDGSVGRIGRVRESVGGYGFYDACARALRAAGAWEPARNQAGEAVASQRRFRCEFSLSR